jgi:WD40 repeat protein
MLRRSSGLAALAVALGCGRRGDVDLGEVHALSDGGTGGSNGVTCGAVPCENHSGEKTFVVAGALADSAERFATSSRRPPGTDGAREPALIYPSHETRLPLNIARILYEWTSPPGEATYELRFTGPRTRVSVYTTELRFTPDDEQWDWIAESNRGAEVVVEVSVLGAGSVEAWTSRPITLSFSDSAVEGAIYYWSTGAEGVMKALISDTTPVKFYAIPEGTEKAACVGCHSLSRDGKRLAVVGDGDVLREIAVADRAQILPSSSGGAGGAPAGGAGGAPAMPSGKGEPKDVGTPASWTTFSPDGKRLLVASDGALTLLDADTGARVGPDDGVVPTPSGLTATHPDWSPNGDRVAITLAEKGGSKQVEDGSIAVLPFDGTNWGAAEILVPSAGAGDNNFFPVFSPDSRFLAYVQATGKSSDAASAELRLLRLSDSKIFDLPRLNQRVGAMDSVIGVGNSMPSWAPSTRPGVFWLAFSSLRAYGTVRPVDTKKDQLWIAAIDPALPDPGAAAFWAPFQNLEHGNHRAFWTHTAEDSQCLCAELCGDDVDNDCDGVADESECRASCDARETCNDGIDNDCNCAVDDCSVEVCDDGVDNDGDGATDADDASCKAP